MPIADSTQCTLVDKIEQLPELKPFPAVATKVLQAADDPDCGPYELIEILQCDPSIALKLLKVANSSIYGFAGSIVSIDQAVVILGLSTVRDLVVAAAAADVFATGNSAKASREKLWDHSLACAAVAAVLAEHTNVSKEEAFLAGILHDVGKLVFFDLAPEEYEKATKGSTCGDIITLEGDVFGVNHQEVGNRCGSEWGLPMEINDAISFHHSPSDATESFDLVNLIAVSDELSHLWIGGAESNEQELNEIMERSKLKIDPELLDGMHQQVLSEFESIKQACS